MNKTGLNYKVSSVSKSSKKKSSARDISKRIEELALPPTRILIENKEQFKRILTDRAVDSIEKKLRQTASLKGDDENSNLPETISCFSEPMYMRKVPAVKVASLSYNKLKASTLGPTRTDVLSRPLKRRIPEPVREHPPVRHVKPSTLRYIPNERILELAKPRKSASKVLKRRRWKKKSVAPRTSWKR